jgi:hypothetical protein
LVQATRMQRGYAVDIEDFRYQISDWEPHSEF